MNQNKTPNLEIGCKVRSCMYHCGGKDNCSLPGITVEPCKNCGSGKPNEESMCGNYCPR